ncbi:MAG TPA: hypothetical protein VMV07_13050 [Streptosporangiaceae bacterium]|nr:hypothetical protein [Streptosporangiaceae bacterium]
MLAQVDRAARGVARGDRQHPPVAAGQAQGAVGEQGIPVPDPGDHHGGAVDVAGSVDIDMANEVLPAGQLGAGEQVHGRRG